MKLAIFSHCAIDTISICDSISEQIGGAACYGGFTARKLGFDVELFTKFGSDFPYEEYLSKNKISFSNALSEKPTTRFRIQIFDSDREMFLETQCQPLEYASTNADGVIASPLFDEISSDLFEKIKNNTGFLFLDPQGFLRRVDQNKKIYLEKTELDLSKVSAIKVGVDEINHIVSDSSIESMKTLNKMGVEYILYTDKRNISLLVKDKLYSLTLPNKEIFDTTGLGDIFCSTFCCTMIKEKDFLWAFCFAGGAVQAALDSKELGLNKIPQKGAIQTNGSYFYNTVKFKQI